MSDTIERDVFEGAGPNDIDVRLYNDSERDVPQLPSVTTVLKTRNDDKSNLYDWQERNDGEGDNAHHDHLFWYSRHVGTLGHWHALHELDEDLEWTMDEDGSLQELQNMYEPEVEGSSAREVLYSILRGDRDKAGGTVASWGEFYDKYPPYKNESYYRDALMEQVERDIAFFRDAQTRLWSKLGVSPLNVISVEQYLFNDVDGYAGQVDLVYEDHDGNIVVADLKSSSGCYDKHQIQGAAYARAVEQDENLPDTVDRIEVHRAHPRTGLLAVHTPEDAPGKQAVHTTQYWYDGIDDLWGDFESLLSNFDGYDWADV